jgi:hypothetical protein
MCKLVSAKWAEAAGAQGLASSKRENKVAKINSKQKYEKIICKFVVWLAYIL